MKLTVAIIFILFIIAFVFVTHHSVEQPHRAQTSLQSRNSVTMKTLSLREQLSSLMIFHSSGTEPEKLAKFVKQYQPGGLIFLRDNIPQDLDQLPTLIDRIHQGQQPPLFIAIDQEGGLVKRLPNDNFPGAEQLKDLPVEETRKASVQRSVLLQNYGFNLNFAPVADSTEDKNSFMYPRVFGSDPTQVAEKVAATVEGANPYIFSTLKHFPGHGETAVDTHTHVATIRIDKATWEKRAKPPFVAGIQAGAKFVMMGHLQYAAVDDLPATLSPAWNQILRQELNFQGLIVTDDMIMLQKTKDPRYQDLVTNTIKAINAGNDIILIVTDFNLQQDPERNVDIDALFTELEKAIETGALKRERIEESARKIQEFRSSLPRE